MLIRKFICFAAVVTPMFCGAVTREEAQKEYQSKISALEWQRGPTTGQVSDKASLKLDSGLAMLDMQNSDKFLQINGNPPSATRNVIAAEGWFAAFQFEPVGYVKDDEKIDADALLKQIQEGNAQGNEERKKQGYPELVADGWYMPPHYDPDTKRLEWALKLHSGADTILNYTVRLLGRTGVESATLVSSPATLERDIKSFKKALEGFDFNSGERYSEFKQGDRVAEFGLAALVAGGAAAVATKAGFWKVLAGSLAAFWKVIAAFCVAGWAGIRKFLSRNKAA
jgi:uncharacterized membrane-anchored protein